MIIFFTFRWILEQQYNPPIKKCKIQQAGEKGDSKNEKKRLFQSILNFGNSSKRSKIPASKVEQKVETIDKTRKVNLGWLNYDERSKGYVHV